jgi:hypothetical protein
VAKQGALKAFEKAVEGGTDPETLIQGAKRYALERRGQDPKYTKHPATWLNKGCWEDEPDGVPVIDEEGNVVAVEQPQPERNGFTGVADQLIDEIARGERGPSW